MNNKKNYQVSKWKSKTLKGQKHFTIRVYSSMDIPDKMVPIGIHCRLKWKHKARQCLKGGMLWLFPFYLFFIRVRSFAMLVSYWLTHCCLVNLIDVTLACEDANSKFVEVCWGLLLLLMLMIVLATVWCILGSWSLVITPNFCSDFEHRVCSRFWCWSLGKILKLVFFRWCFAEVTKLNLDQGAEARLSQYFEF